MIKRELSGIANHIFLSKNNQFRPFSATRLWESTTGDKDQSLTNQPVLFWLSQWQCMRCAIPEVLARVSTLPVRLAARPIFWPATSYGHPCLWPEECPRSETGSRLVRRESSRHPGGHTRTALAQKSANWESLKHCIRQGIGEILGTCDLEEGDCKAI